MGVNFHESDTDRIECKVTVRAEIEISGRGRRDYESDSTECWISIPLSATLRNGLQQVSIGYASEYSRELFRAEDALTKYLVPYIYAKDLDKHAERFLEKYCPRALEEPMPLPIKEIVENMGLTVYHAPLPDGIFGRTYFNDANVEVFTNKTCSETEDRTICPGTILVNPDVVFMRNIGSTNNTVIHECVHWDKHYKFFELQKLLNPDIQAISCAVVEDYKKKSNELEDELSWMEWQANALAPKILIPAKTGKAKLSEILNRLHKAYRGRLRDGYVMELAISEFADFFKVSTTAAKIRAVELGFEQAAGVFNFVDGKNYPPFSFKKGSLKKGQTFVIDRNNVIIQSLLNPDLSEDIAARRFIHAGGLLVINDPQYVSIVEDSEPTLTEYALEHVDECCLVFDRTTRVSTQYDDSFYRICFLCRDADSKSFVEAKFNPREGKNEDVQKRAREMTTIAAEAKRISDILAEIPSSFCGTLDYHVKRRGYTNEKMEERTGISSRMIQDYVNSKFEVIHGRNYFISKTNGLMEQKTYYFDAEGKLVQPDAEKNGIVKESDDTWYYYVDGVKTYAGLIQIDGDYYYVNSSFKVIHNQSYYVSKTNGLKAQGTYEFDADGKMVIATDDAGGVKNGIVKETEDTWYYYVDGTKTYAGLIVIDGSYYYVNSKCEVIHGRQYFISKTNGLLVNGTYTFDEDGKMNLN